MGPARRRHLRPVRRRCWRRTGGGRNPAGLPALQVGRDRQFRVAADHAAGIAGGYVRRERAAPLRVEREIERPAQIRVPIRRHIDARVPVGGVIAGADGKENVVVVLVIVAIACRRTRCAGSRRQRKDEAARNRRTVGARVCRKCLRAGPVEHLGVAGNAGKAEESDHRWRESDCICRKGGARWWSCRSTMP